MDELVIRSMMKQARLRFSLDDDLCLLREVIEHNPYKDTSKWNVIRENVTAVRKKEFSRRTIKEHVDHLLLKSCRGELQNAGDQLSQERNTYLEDIKTLVMKYRNIKCVLNGEARRESHREKRLMDHKIKMSIPQNSHVTGADMADTEEYCEVLFNNETDHLIQNDHDFNTSTEQILQEETTIVDPLTSHRCCQQDGDYRMKLLEIEEKKLNLEEKRLVLDQAKFELEKRERLNRLEMEKKDREIHLRLIELLIEKQVAVSKS